MVPVGRVTGPGSRGDGGGLLVAVVARTIESWASTVPFDFVIASSSGLVPYLRTGRYESHSRLDRPCGRGQLQKWLDYAQASRGPKRWLFQLEGTRL